MLVNSERVRNWAVSFRQRIQRDKNEPDDAIREGYQIALSREPTNQELLRMRSFINKQSADYQAGRNKDEARSLAMDDFCQLLMCMNEFIYVE